MGCGKRYSEFCALSSYRFAGEVTCALIQPSGWAWKQPSDATDLIRVIVTPGKGGSLRGYPQPGWFLENFNPITALENIPFVVVTIYPSLFYAQKTCERANLDKASETKVPPYSQISDTMGIWQHLSPKAIRDAHPNDSSCCCFYWLGFCSVLLLAAE